MSFIHIFHILIHRLKRVIATGGSTKPFCKKTFLIPFNKLKVNKTAREEGSSRRLGIRLKRTKGTKDGKQNEKRGESLFQQRREELSSDRQRNFDEWGCVT